MKLFLLFITLYLSQISLAQYSISGRVIDSVSGKPIAGINIFISHSSIGAYSDSNGVFKLDRIPPGEFELIISSLNYETQAISINSRMAIKPLMVALKPTAHELQEVIVQQYDEDGWERWGRYFNAHFLGTSLLMEQCSLLNPDVVKFKYTRKANMVRAFATEKLIFENRALGYRVKYLLSNFEFYLGEGVFAFSGYPLFEEMKPKNSSEEKKWVKNREEAYSGSIMHFMRSLYHDKLNEEGFEIRRIFKVSEEEALRATNCYKAYTKSLREKKPIDIESDSLEYYKKASKLGRYEHKVILNIPLTKADLVTPIDTSIDQNAQYFGFEQWLSITYLHKKEPYEYSKLFFKRASNENISTDIKLTYQKNVAIYPNGTYFRGDNIYVDGYWAWWEKISTHLPIDYYPPHELNSKKH